MKYPYRNPKTGKFGRAIVKHLPNIDAIQFASDFQDIKHIKNHLGEIAQEFDSFFVVVAGGDYIAVWGMYNIVPHLHKPVYRIL
jgi:hypothetical protein